MSGDLTHMNKPLLPALILCFLPAAAIAQSTWVVNPSGGGDFTTIYDAQLAASPGDTLILQGTFPGLMLTKRLHLIADGSFLNDDLIISAPGSLSIHGGSFYGMLINGSVVSLSGVTTTLRVDAGSHVVARDCTFRPASLLFSGARVAAGARANFDSCTFQGRDAYAVFGVLSSTPALQIMGHAQLRDCSLQGGLEFSSPWIALAGHAAIELTGSVDLRRCTLTSGGATAPLLWGSGTVRTELTNVVGTTPNPATITVVPATLPWMTGADAVPGGTMQVAVDGPPATLATISASLDMRTPMASWVGDIWLDAAYLPLSFGITDGSGSFAISLPMPAQVQRGLHVTFQGLVIPNGGSLVATAPAVLQIR